MSYFRTAILLAALTALFMGIGYLIGGQGGMLLALLVAGAMNLFAYWNSDKMVLRMYGAHEVDERSAPELYALVRRLAANAGLPMPRVYIMDNPQPNAFATGRNPENAAVAVTTGLMRTVDEAELAGVIAHELGHIRNRDTLLMTITATVAGAISMLANFGLYFGGRSNDSGHIGIVGTLLLVILGPLAAALVQMAISRTREYEADRAGAEISRRSFVAGSGLAKDRRRRAPHPQHAGRAQSGFRASLHREPAVRRAHGQSVRDPPERRKPGGAACRNGAGDGRERRLITSRHERNGTVVPGAAGCGTRALGLIRQVSRDRPSQ